MDRLKAAEQLRKALQKYLENLEEDTTAQELPLVFDEWEPDTKYKSGEIVAYGLNTVGSPQLYRVIKNHTSEINTPPGNDSGSLYQAFGVSSDGVPLWVEPYNKQSGYNKGNKVSYNGTIYTSLKNNNLATPGEDSKKWEVT